MLDIKTYPDPRGLRTNLSVSFDDRVTMNAVEGALLREIVAGVAKRYVEEHYTELVAKLDQNAIANLAVAAAGKKIAEEIRSKPTVVYAEPPSMLPRRAWK